MSAVVCPPCSEEELRRSPVLEVRRPRGVDFEDTLSYSVGVGRVLGASRWSAMVSLAGFSKGLEGAAAPVQLNAALLTLISRRQSIAVSAGIGLNDSSGGFSLGTSWRISN